MIKAVIFDMDGLLIDSEPMWQQAEMAQFAKVGLELTPEMCTQTTGMRIDEVIQHWYEQFPLNKQPLSREALKQHILDDVIDRIRKHGKPRPGVGYILDFFRDIGVKMALASSSHYRVINAVLDVLHIAHYFQVIHSAEEEPYGKPHPAVYLTTAEKLNVSPGECLAFEDSLNGVIAAKAARMRCVVVPPEAHLHDPRFALADLVLASLREFDELRWAEINARP
ncbi:MAG: hexitol phosphatase HxpB [Calditrichaeota bacterium]|nr:MAG: hexitol phosphatase HxpB [Calditrichota bacterium]